MARLASDVLEAGVHYQGSKPTPRHIAPLPDVCSDAFLYNRSKDAGTKTGDWVVELMSPDPWFKDVVPNVRPQASLSAWS